MMTEVTDSAPEFDRSEPNVKFIALFGVATLALLGVVILGIQFYFNQRLEREVYVKVLSQDSQALKELRAREDEILNSYRYIDREKGTVRLPVNRAMELLLQESAQGKLRYPQRPAPVEMSGAGNAAN
ncbi:MAG: hypothetical protein ACUVXB_09905 [Bryobacteraceae bacterium]